MLGACRVAWAWRSMRWCLAAGLADVLAWRLPRRVGLAQRSLCAWLGPAAVNAEWKNETAAAVTCAANGVRHLCVNECSRIYAGKLAAACCCQLTYGTQSQPALGQ